MLFTRLTCFKTRVLRVTHPGYPFGLTRLPTGRVGSLTRTRPGFTKMQTDPTHAGSGRVLGRVYRVGLSSLVFGLLGNLTKFSQLWYNIILQMTIDISRSILLPVV